MPITNVKNILGHQCFIPRPNNLSQDKQAPEFIFRDITTRSMDNLLGYLKINNDDNLIKKHREVILISNKLIDSRKKLQLSDEQKEFIHNNADFNAYTFMENSKLNVI